jgi:beta-phosphoglucomutase-like phosphatase (HAD superfamily)
MPQNVQAIFFDLGDTIMDEKTEVKNASGTTLAADLFPGMADALFALHQQGYRLALVADSRPETPLNVLRQHGLLERFEHLAISENVGVQKPDPAIFLHTLEALRIPEQDYPKVIMVGNNLERDIAGANRLGLRPVFFHANDSRRTVAQTREEIPRHTVANAQELMRLVEALSQQVSGDQAPTYRGAADDLALAVLYAPWISFDEAEPFFPEVVGYTIFRREQQSASFLRRIVRDWRPDWKTAIEYAIWWDWDIGHLYELEHVWVYLDEAGELVWVEASSHGVYASMLLEDRTIPHEGNHPLVISQPGKHAFSPTPHWFEMFRDMVFAETSPRAGNGGVLVKPEYSRQIPKNPEVDARVAAWLQKKAFQPTLRFNQIFKVQAEHLVPWPVLDTWIPLRVNWWLSQL